MTTSAREDRKAGAGSSTLESAEVLTAPPKLRRRPGVVVAAVAVTALGVLMGAWAWSATTSTEEVLAATRTIHRGEVIRGRDVERIRISGDSGLSTIPGSAYDGVIGQHAALDVGAGGLLTPDSTTPTPLPPHGQSIVGISLTPAQVPALAMHGGDRVRIILTPDDGGEPAAVPTFTTAVVLSTAVDDTTGNTVVNVVVPYADAAVLAARAATGHVALVLDSGAE